MKKVIVFLFIIIGLAGVYMVFIKGHTPPILKKGSIAEFDYVNLNGVRQSILIRGEDRKNPVLLYIHGGPGEPETAMIRKSQKRYEKYFTVVNWDQRGSGKSYDGNIGLDTLNAETISGDAVRLVEYLRKRFGQDKIYIMAHSWGTYIGMRIVKEHPEYFHAYIGLGQTGDQQKNEFVIRKYALENAVRDGNKKAVKELKAAGEPPYGRNDFQNRITVNRKWAAYYGGVLWGRHNSIRLTYEGILDLEYNLFDLIKYTKGEKLYYRESSEARWEFYSSSLIRDIPEVKVPVYFCQGLHDNNTSYKLAKEYFEVLKAPIKRFETFSNSAHFPNIEEAKKFSDYLINTVLAETRQGGT